MCAKPAMISLPCGVDPMTAVLSLTTGAQEWKTEVERRCEKIKTMQQIADLVLSKTGQSKCRMADKLALVNDQMTSLLAKTAVRQVCQFYLFKYKPSRHLLLVG